MNVKKILLAYSLLVFYTISPLILYSVAGQIRAGNNCPESTNTPCVIGAVDWTFALYWMDALGWLIFLILPTGVCALLFYTIKRIVEWARRNKRPR